MNSRSGENDGGAVTVSDSDMYNIKSSTLDDETVQKMKEEMSKHERR